MSCDRSALCAIADGAADARLPPAGDAGGRGGQAAHAEACPTCAPLLAAVRAARRAIRATATFPEPSQQAWFRVRYGVGRRFRARAIATVAGLAVAGAVALGLAGAAVLAFLP